MVEKTIAENYDYSHINGLSIWKSVARDDRSLTERLSDYLLGIEKKSEYVTLIKIEIPDYGKYSKGNSLHAIIREKLKVEGFAYDGTSGEKVKKIPFREAKPEKIHSILYRVNEIFRVADEMVLGEDIQTQFEFDKRMK